MTYVAKGTPPGYDVNTAIDYLQSFNSEWPLLKVHSTGNYGGAIDHNLGYYPFYLVASTTLGGAVDAIGVSTYGVSTSQFVRSSGSGSPRYYLFRLDLESNFTAPIVPGVTTQAALSQDYVFKIAKDGKDDNSQDMRDFSLHSNTKSPMVHMVNNGLTSSGGGIGRSRTVAHNLGYVPTVFVYIRPSTNSAGLSTSRYVMIPPPIGASIAYYTVSSSNVFVTVDSSFFSANVNVSVVILKDPFDKQVINRTFP